MVPYLYSPVNSKDEKERGQKQPSPLFPPENIEIKIGRNTVRRRRPIKGNSNTRIQIRGYGTVMLSKYREVRRSHLSDDVVHHPLRISSIRVVHQSEAAARRSSWP
jgi:hypothetical protein